MHFHIFTILVITPMFWKLLGFKHSTRITDMIAGEVLHRTEVQFEVFLAEGKVGIPRWRTASLKYCKRASVEIWERLVRVSQRHKCVFVQQLGDFWDLYAQTGTKCFCIVCTFFGMFLQTFGLLSYAKLSSWNPKHYKKNPAYGRNQISRPKWLVAPHNLVFHLYLHLCLCLHLHLDLHLHRHYLVN